jgi:hypothetical protein
MLRYWTEMPDKRMLMPAGLASIPVFIYEFYIFYIDVFDASALSCPDSPVREFHMGHYMKV